MKRPILLIFLLFVNFLIAQKKIYTQKEVNQFVENELNWENIGDLKSMLESNYKLQGWSKYYSLLCNMYREKAVNDSSIFYGNKAIDYYKNSKIKSSLDEKSLLGVYFNLGLISYRQKEFEMSIKYLQKSLNLEKKYPYKYKSYIRGYLAGNHFKMGNNRKALEYYHINLKDTIYTAIPQPYTVTLTRVGTLYTPEYLNQPDSAFFYFNKAAKAAEKYKHNLPIIYGKMAELHLKKFPDSALYFYRLSKREFENFIFKKNISPDNIDYFQIVNNSYVNIYDGKLKTAIKDLSQVIDSLSIQENDKSDRDILLKAYDFLILAHERDHHLEKANERLKEKNEFENIFHKEELNQKLAKLELDYETVKKEEQIQELKEEAKSKNTIAQQQRLLLLGGIGLLLLMLVIGGLAYRQKNLKNKFEKVSLQQRLLRSQMNPHFLFNALNTAQILITKKSQEAEKYISNLAKLLRLTLENSREDFVPLIDEVTALKSYLDLQSNFLKKFDYTIEIASDIDKEWVEIPPMLLQPIVENAVVHGISNIDYRGIIKILLQKENDKSLACTIIDNGKGCYKDNFKKSEIYTKDKSISMDIVKERLSIYHGQKKKEGLLSLNYNGEVDNEKIGTQVNFSVPYKTN